MLFARALSFLLYATTMFSLVDCNSFYASCEQIFRPDLRNKPVVVLSNNDGCIVARSKEAKALSIPDLQAYFQIKQILQQHNVHVFSSNYELYGDISHRIVEILQTFAPALEVYSIDECFLSLHGMSLDFYDYGLIIKKALWQQTKMPVSVGTAKTKTLAKLANHIAKKSRRLNGSCFIECPDDWIRVFHKLPVKTIWGVGSRIAIKLNALGIHSVQDLKQANAKQLGEYFNVNMARTIYELNNIPCLTLELQPPPKKQIYSSRSFGKKVYALPELQQAISHYATTAMQKLRQQQAFVKTIMITIETSRFHHLAYRNNQVIQLPYPTNDTRLIIDAAKHAVARMYKAQLPYAKVGIGLIELIDEHHLQPSLFNQQQTSTATTLMHTIDKINARGLPPLTFASSGIDPLWKMQRQLKSPSYTTRFHDFPVINTEA